MAEYKWGVRDTSMSHMDFVKDFVRSLECPFITTEITDTQAIITVDDSTVIRYEGDWPKIYVNDKWVSDLIYQNNNQFLLIAVYSDTFFHLYNASYQWWGGGAKFSYLYEKIDDVNYEGYMGLNTDDWDDIHIYDYYIYNKDSGKAYKHAKMFDYVGEIVDDVETVDFSHDVLFDPSGTEVTRIADMNLINCTKVGPENISPSGLDRHRIVTIDGKDYFSIECNMLIPLFDPEPEPEPNPEESSD